MSFRYPQVKNHEKWPPAVRFTNSTPKVFNTEKSQAPHNQRLVGFIKRSYFQFVIRLKVAARAGVVLRSQTSCPTPATRRSRKCRVVRPLAGEACSQKETSRGKTGGFKKWLLGLDGITNSFAGNFVTSEGHTPRDSFQLINKARNLERIGVKGEPF